jgi:serine/threonine protein kinase
MGEVYRALDTKLDRPVALKFLSGGDIPQPEIAGRFLDEIQALAKVTHPNIVTIYGAEKYEGCPFYVMEFVEGSTLADLIDEDPPGLDDSLRICIDTCRGLQRAHECGLVHRDINPHNILVSQNREAKILDFGLAAFRGRPRYCEVESCSGTLNYMSPEQLQDAPIDHRSDLFSLGIVLYQLITGKLPFDGEYEAAIIYSTVNEAPRPFAEHLSGPNPALLRIINKALEKDPEERFQSAREMAENMKSILDSGQPYNSVAPPETSPKQPSIAILHFKDMSPEKDQEFFCDGIAEEIISALAKTPGIKVASPASVARFKGHEVDLTEIGEKLGVDTVLEGSVRKAGSRLRITAQLVDVNNGYCLWSEIFDRDIADVFVIHDTTGTAAMKEGWQRALSTSRKQ